MYDLSINAFRNYLENDLCSFCIQYEYSECNDFELIESIFSDLFQNHEEREYTLSVLASLLDSSLPNDNLIIFKGHGSNGKSLLVRLLSKTLGPFSTSLSSSFFNQDPTVTNGPSPTMSDLEFKKVAFVAEPSINSLKTNIIKRLCGNDEVSSRGLFCNNVKTFKISTKFIIAMNNMPTFSNADEALWRRLLILNFSTKFVENPRKCNEKKIIFNLYETIETSKEILNAFFNLLLTYMN